MHLKYPIGLNNAVNYLCSMRWYAGPKYKINPDVLTPDEKLRPQIVEEVESLKSNTKDASRELKIINDKHLIIFIHGYNNTEREMHERAKYLDEQFGSEHVITTAFNWISYANIFGYWGDKTRAKRCAKYFAFYMEEIRKSDIHNFEQIDIICHSMGNQILVKSIIYCQNENKLDLFSGCNIIAVAPDVSKEEYRAAIKLVVDTDSKPDSIVSNWIHYWNDNDGPLFLSKFANMEISKGGIKLSRIAGSGHCNIGSSRFKSIQWEKESFLNHGYVGNILDKDHEFKNELFRRLNLGICPDK